MSTGTNRLTQPRARRSTQLGNVAAGLELYREVSGDKEDKAIENGPETVHLKEDEHFHSGPPRGNTRFT